MQNLHANLAVKISTRLWLIFFTNPSLKWWGDRDSIYAGFPNPHVSSISPNLRRRPMRKYPNPSLKTGPPFIFHQLQPIRQAIVNPIESNWALFRARNMPNPADLSAFCSFQKIYSSIFRELDTFFMNLACHITGVYDGEMRFWISITQVYIPLPAHCQNPRKYLTRFFPDLTPKTSPPFIFHLHQPIRQAIVNPIEPNWALFRARFMPDPVNRSAICRFQKIYSSIFRELDTFLWTSPAI